ncbi:GyrI-like domain-containing protein [Aeromonas caviae]|uniref:GyrI-like domain-containing protein n=1 Tax=Aeromonas caviae TaxID=648 RepID=UPI002541F1AC|nr:GyrI-like domain-containing protein [Aeromonas caviae]MDK3166032.1 GyrI-like domain-containing protein [Aeromonas caviae]
MGRDECPHPGRALRRGTPPRLPRPPGRALYRDWLPASGEELRDFPLFFHYHNFVHEVPTHELVTDIYLPLA